MRHGSLFSGLGGFDLASEWMGWENVFHCEIEPFPRKVLSYYWPKAIAYSDITKTDFTLHRGQIDILTGGFPCQPYSHAGKRRGKDDERHLWPEMLRSVREIAPRWVVGENVFGLTTWNDGLVFEEVQAELEAEGYEVQPFILPAAGVEAPHRRYRVWFVAYDNKRDGKKVRFQAGGEIDVDGTDGEGSNPNTTSNGVQGGGNERELHPEREEGDQRSENLVGFQQPRGWEDFPTQSPIRGRDDGLSSKLDGITLSSWRDESIKGYGNAVVPQVVLQIFRSIEQYEMMVDKPT